MRFLTLILTFLFLHQASASLKELNSLKAPFSLPALSYTTKALEPVIDEETMSIHHSRHHQGYVNNLNSAIGTDKTDLQSLFSNISKKSAAIRNNAGGHWNHSFFWTILTPDAKKQKMSKEMEKEIIKYFKSVNAFKKTFEKFGAAQFGSGWVWLIRNDKGELAITSTANQDNPLMDLAPLRGTPILGVDVWEHAYYLKYQNKRAEYLENIWKIVNWNQVEAYDKEAKQRN